MSENHRPAEVYQEDDARNQVLSGMINQNPKLRMPSLSMQVSSAHQDTGPTLKSSLLKRLHLSQKLNSEQTLVLVRSGPFEAEAWLQRNVMTEGRGR